MEIIKTVAYSDIRSKQDLLPQGKCIDWKRKCLFLDMTNHKITLISLNFFERLACFLKKVFCGRSDSLIKQTHFKRLSPISFAWVKQFELNKVEAEMPRDEEPIKQEKVAIVPKKPQASIPVFVKREDPKVPVKEEKPVEIEKKPDVIKEEDPFESKIEQFIGDGDLYKALKYLEDLPKEKRARHYFEIGRIFHRWEDFEKVIEVINKCSSDEILNKLNDKHYPARKYLYDCLAERYLEDDELEKVREILKKNPNENISLKLSKKYFEKNDLERATKILEDQHAQGKNALLTTISKKYYEYKDLAKANLYNGYNEDEEDEQHFYIQIAKDYAKDEEYERAYGVLLEIKVFKKWLINYLFEGNDFYALQFVLDKKEMGVKEEPLKMLDRIIEDKIDFVNDVEGVIKIIKEELPIEKWKESAKYFAGIILSESIKKGVQMVKEFFPPDELQETFKKLAIFSIRGGDYIEGKKWIGQMEIGAIVADDLFLEVAEKKCQHGYVSETLECLSNLDLQHSEKADELYFKIGKLLFEQNRLYEAADVVTPMQHHIGEKEALLVDIRNMLAGR